MNELFEREAIVLLQDLATAPRNNATAKLNDLIVRCRRVRVQILLMHELRSAMPKMTGKDRKQKVKRTRGRPYGTRCARLTACYDGMPRGRS